MSDYYLKPGLPQPVASRDGLDAAYFEGLAAGELRIQQCGDCNGWQWGPEWICHHCHSDNVCFTAVEPKGRIYSYERVWHPVHPALAEQGPYVVALVELPHCDNVRVIGNLLGDAEAEVQIGAEVTGVFEHHAEAEPAFTLLHWQRA